MPAGGANGAPILVVDDDPGCRALCSSLLGQAGFPTREAANGHEAIAAAHEFRPRLVLLDVCLPGLSGYEVCRELRDRFDDDVPIIFVSGEKTDTLDGVAGLLVGADDYLRKPFSPDELLARVRRLVRRAGPVSARNGHLTPREHEVLRLLARGAAQLDIALELRISTKTVSTHIERILSKLGARSRAQAVAVAYLDGLVEARPS
jgi:DNA-binding NarL/FixJ family response regulator